MLYCLTWLLLKSVEMFDGEKHGRARFEEHQAFYSIERMRMHYKRGCG